MTTQNLANSNIMHHLYLSNFKDWRTIRDCIAGQRRIKEQTTIYLPMPNALDQSKQNKDRYTLYLERAVFYNVTGRTHAALIGEVFDKDAKIHLPPELQPLERSLGFGLTLQQQARRTLSDVLALGRAGLFADYPRTTGEVSRQQILNGEVKPIIRHYAPENILNWDVTDVNGELVLSYIILREIDLTPLSISRLQSGNRIKERLRVLRLENGVFRVEVYPPVERGATFNLSLGPEETYTPVDSRGVPFDRILFTFVGAENNDEFADKPPMLDLANLNVAHYRNSADYEESSYLVGQPTPVISGLTQQWVEDVLSGQILLGSRAAIPLPAGATADLLQPEPNTMPFEAMGHKEEQMARIGARLVSERGVQRTLGEVEEVEAAETSILGNVTRNVNQGYQQVLEWSALFVGAAANEIEFELNTDFSFAGMSAQDRQQLIAEWQSGGISFEEYRMNLRRGGILLDDDGLAAGSIESEPGIDIDSDVDPNPQEAGRQ